MEIGNRVKTGDTVFGLVYGIGKVRNVWRDAYYKFEVEYANGQVVPYLENGVPSWYNGLEDLRTVFLPAEVELGSLDLAPVCELLPLKKIIALRRANKLIVRCPSGVWSKNTECPDGIIESYLNKGQLHLFKGEF